MRNVTELVGQSSGGETLVKVDKDSGGMVNITPEHEAIHAGRAFHKGYSVTTAATDDHRTGFSFTTPAASVAELHMTFSVSASVAAEAFLVEGVTIDSDPGANVAPLNRKRNSVVTSFIGSQETTPTANEVTTLNEAQWAAATFSGGTELEHVNIIAGGGPKAIGGSARGDQEWELKAGTKYAFYIQNLSAAANVHNLSMDWYEVY